MPTKHPMSMIQLNNNTRVKPSITPLPARKFNLFYYRFVSVAGIFPAAALPPISSREGTRIRLVCRTGCRLTLIPEGE
jgi:hypothetical protein